MNTVSRSSYLPHVDGLRAIAVIIVLFFHLGVPGFSGGFVGVDVFFVISGFLITRLILNEREISNSFSYQNFYSRRIRRLLPALFVTLLLTAITAVLVLSPMHLQRFGGALSSAVFSVSNIYFWQEAGYFDVDSALRPLLHTWSLSVEEQFYLFWPLFVVTGHRWLGKNGVFRAVLIVSLASLVLCFFLFAAHGQSWSTPMVDWLESISNLKNTMFFLLPFRVFEFGVGAMLAKSVIDKEGPSVLYELGFLFGCLFILLAVVLFDEQMLFPGLAALVPCIGAGLIIATGSRSRIAKVITNRYALWIGLISYSLYLVHWPLIVFWEYRFGNIELMGQLIIGVLSILLAALMYRYVETPFRKRDFQFSIRGAGPYAVAALLLFSLGFDMWKNQGWSWRVPKSTKIQVVTDAASFHKEYFGGAGYPSLGMVLGTGQPDILVVGDSHAHQYLEGVVKEVAEPFNYSIASFYGISCIHLPNFSRLSNERNYDVGCQQYTNEAIALARSIRDKPLVILVAHSWLTQLKRAYLLNSSPVKKEGLSARDIVKGLIELSQQVRPAKVFVLGALPGTGERNLFDELNRPFWEPDLDGPSNIGSTNYSDEVAEFNGFLAEKAKTTLAFEVLDPSDALCTDNVCSNFGSGGEFIYSDTSHLTKYGSRKVISHFSDTIHRALRSTSSSP